MSKDIMTPEEIQAAAIDRAVRAVTSSRTLPQLATARRYAVLAVNCTAPAGPVAGMLTLFDKCADIQERRIRRHRVPA